MSEPSPETLQFITDLGYNQLKPETRQEANLIIENITGCIDRACAKTYTGWRFTPEPIRREIMLAVKYSMLYHKLKNDLDYSVSELENVIKNAVSEQNYRTLGYIRANQQQSSSPTPIKPRKRKSKHGCLLFFILILLLVFIAGGTLYYFSPVLVQDWMSKVSFSNSDELLSAPTPTPAPLSTATPTPQPTPTPFPTATPFPTPVPTPDWQARARSLYWEHKKQFDGPKTGDIIRIKTTVGKEITGKVIRLSPKILELRTREGSEKFLNTQIVKEQRVKLFSYDYARYKAKKQLIKERKASTESNNY